MINALDKIRIAVKHLIDVLYFHHLYRVLDAGKVSSF